LKENPESKIVRILSQSRVIDVSSQRIAAEKQSFLKVLGFELTAENQYQQNRQFGFHQVRDFEKLLIYILDPTFFCCNAYNSKIKAVSPSADRPVISDPLWSFMISCEMLNPIPEPFVFVVKKGTKIFSCNSRGIFGPLLVTVIQVRLCDADVSSILILRAFSFP
jgi:hypothetical protein